MSIARYPISLLLGFFLYQHVLAQPLFTNPQNKARLQRGAKLYMNYCSGCHSLNYMRYNQMAEGLGLIGFDGQIDTTWLKNNVIFTQATIHDPIRIALPPEDAKQWFGIVPRDLSLITREKGTEWLYTYLKSFYEDNSKLWGTNNYLVPDVAMPNILDTLSNDLAHTQLDSNLKDLVAFLAYVGEPVQLRRYRLGVFVIGFLIVLFFFSLRLQSIYWRKGEIK